MLLKGQVKIETKLVKDHSDKLIIKVSDTGIGIKPEDKLNLFQAFKQISPPGKIVEGTGLGLHLSQKLALLINGKIEFESIYGQGSCFSLILTNKQENNLDGTHTHH